MLTYEVIAQFVRDMDTMNVMTSFTHNSGIFFPFVVVFTQMNLVEKRSFRY